MSLLAQLKKNKTVRGRRWIIERSPVDNFIKDVKMIFEPENYPGDKKDLLGDKALLKELEKEKEIQSKLNLNDGENDFTGGYDPNQEHKFNTREEAIAYKEYLDEKKKNNS